MATAVASSTTPRPGAADRAGAVAAADAIERSVARLCWQRIELGRRPQAVVMGVRHRRPVSFGVTLEVAAILRRRGVTTVVRRMKV